MKHLTLSELLSMVKDHIKATMPGSYWVTGEIAEVKLDSRKGHCYITLIEKQENSPYPAAKVRANIWQGRAKTIIPKFNKETGESFKPGMQVLFLVEPDFHPVFGFSLSVVDADSSYTIGDMAKKRKEIIERLKKEGLIDRNKKHELPLVIQSVAVVTSESAAGWGDFKNHIENNQFGFRFDLRLYPAVMQGIETEQSVVTALTRIQEHSDRHDVIVIIRGGGSTADLDYFNSYAIGAAISGSPLPVLTGIGHERDDTVTDIVAHTKLKTPTAVANFIIDKAKAFDSRLDESQQKIVKFANKILSDEQNRFQRCVRDLITGTRQAVIKEYHRLSLLSSNIVALTRRSIERAGQITITMVKDLQSAVSSYTQKRESDLYQMVATLKYKPLQITERARTTVANCTRDLTTSIKQHLLKQINQLEKYEQAIKYLDPKNIMTRGFSITIVKGKAVRDASALSPDETLQTILYKGSVTSRVTEVKEDDNG